VTIIKSGLGNRRDKHYYPPDVLETAVQEGLFKGLRAYLDHPTSVDQQIQPERTLRDLVGVYDNPRYIKEGASSRVVADLHVLPSHRWLADSIQSLVSMGYGDKIGISINGRGQTVPDRMKLEEGDELTDVFRVKKFTALPSADLVTEAGAGGGFQQLLESARGATSTIKEQAMSTIQEQLQQLITEDKVSKAALEAILKAHPVTEAETGTDPAADEVEADDDDADDADELADEDVEEAGDEEGDGVEEASMGDCPCAKAAMEEGDPRGMPQSGGTGKAVKGAKGKKPIGRKFGEGNRHLLAEVARLKAQNGRLREALTITQKRDRIAKLLKESKLPVQVRGPLAKRLLRLGSEAEVLDEIRFQQSLLESAVDSVAADLGDYDEVEGAGARFRESAGSGSGDDELLGLIRSHLPLKATK
jgi:hypothetical protein